MVKIGVSLSTGMSGRNFFNSGAVLLLRNKFNLSYNSSSLNLPNTVGNFSKFRIPTFQRVAIRQLYKVQYYALWYLRKPKTLVKYIERDKELNYFRFLILSFLGKLYGKFRQSKDVDIIRNFVYFLPFKIIRGYRALILTSTDCQMDQLLAYAGFKQKIPTVVLAHSWDNLPSRGMLSVRPERLLVWNELMKEQAVNLHSMEEDKVSVVGVPQYEWYRMLSLECNEKSFYKKNNIPDGKRIITYTANASRIFPDEELFVEDLRNYISKQDDLVLIFRLHPEERKEFYFSRYSNDPHVIISNPDNGFRANPTENFGSEEAVKDFISLMKYSAVVINLASTITLDAVLFDTPVICPSFNYKLPQNSWNSASVWYESSHFEEIAKSGAVPIVSSFNELIDEIEIATKNPRFLSAKRQQLSRKMMPELPTSELICKVVEDVIET